MIDLWCTEYIGAVGFDVKLTNLGRDTADKTTIVTWQFSRPLRHNCVTIDPSRFADSCHHEPIVISHFYTTLNANIPLEHAYFTSAISPTGHHPKGCSPSGDPSLPLGHRRRHSSSIIPCTCDHRIARSTAAPPPIIDTKAPFTELTVSDNIHTDAVNAQSVGTQVSSKPQCPPARVSFYVPRVHVASGDSSCAAPFTPCCQIAGCGRCVFGVLRT